MATPLASQILVAIGGGVMQKLGTVPWRKGLQTRGGELPYTFSRADATTCATYIDYDGVIRTSAANSLRIEWVDLDGDGIRETPGILLEGGRTNSCLRSHEIDNATWSKAATTVTANAFDTTGDLVIPNNTNTNHWVQQAITITADENVAGAIRLHPGGYNYAQIVIGDAPQSNRFKVIVDLTNATIIGTVVTGGGVLACSRVVKLASGEYRIEMGGKIGGGVTAAQLFAYVFDTSAHALADTPFAGDTVSGIHMRGAQLERGTVFPSSEIATGASAVTRAADSLTVPFNFGPLDCTILYRCARPVHADAVGDIGVACALADVSISAPKIGGFFQQASRTFAAQSRDTNSLKTAAIPAGASLAFISQHKNLTTVPAVAVDVGSGLTTFGTGAAAMTAYNAQTLQIGGGASQALYGVLLDLIIAKGLYSLSDMLAVSL